MSKTILAFPLLAAVLGEGMDPTEKFGPLTDKIEAGLQANADALQTAEAKIGSLEEAINTATATHAAEITALNAQLTTANEATTTANTALVAANARAEAAEARAAEMEGEFAKIRNTTTNASASAGDLGTTKGAKGEMTALEMFPNLAASMGIKPRD